MANMVGQMREDYKIIFHEDELPLEGLNHNRALHIIVQFEDKFIARVLVDGGSSLNICPLDTVKILGKGFHEIRAGSMTVKDFNGSQRATIGEINHCLQMGPTWFDVEFQVLDISASYNLLLGRPWIHAAGAMVSILHQAVKFEWNHREVIIHGDGSNPIYTSQPIPVTGNRRMLGGETYHHIKRVNAIEKDKWWSSNIESLLAWSGYEPDKGLGKNLQGITKSIQLKCHEEIALAGLRNLFVEDEDIDCSAIIEEEEEKGLIIQIVEKRTILRNWTATPSWAHQVLGDSDEEDEIPKEVVREVENFDNKPKSSLDETKAVNLENAETIKETRISIHLSQTEKEECIRFLKEYKDILAWSYDDMTDMSLKIKEDITKQIKAKVLRVVEYATWLANIVPVSRKDGKVKVYVDYWDLNRASPKDDFLLPNIQILIDNYAKHELQSFVDIFAGYHKIWMDEEDIEKTAFITPWVYTAIR
ncbi:uncharacterized protein [Nicotiana sylvestris]|uniref:uncharacterized protein n=1 Tax=Nicotiana sylvestris TaxID=4096 RepID=UPI00388C54DC